VRNGPDGLAAAVAAAVGGRLRSLILHGSLAAGGFVPGRSDVDLLLVLDGPLPPGHGLEAVVEACDPAPAGGVDLHVVTAEAVAVAVAEPPLELHVGRYGAAPLEVTRRVPGDPDLPAELSMARADGRALFGAAPADVIAPVPAALVAARGRHWLRTWLSLTGDDEHAAHMALTACRIWRFAADGRHVPKPEAAAWVLARAPELVAVRQALHRYATDPAAPVDEDALRRLLEAALLGTALP
jgi:hypothetical protein